MLSEIDSDLLLSDIGIDTEILIPPISCLFNSQIQILILRRSPKNLLVYHSFRVRRCYVTTARYQLVQGPGLVWSRDRFVTYKPTVCFQMV